MFCLPRPVESETTLTRPALVQRLSQAKKHKSVSTLMHQAKLPSKQLQVSLCDEKEFFEMVEADHLPRRHNELPSMELSWA